MSTPNETPKCPCATCQCSCGSETTNRVFCDACMARILGSEPTPPETRPPEGLDVMSLSQAEIEAIISDLRERLAAACAVVRAEASIAGELRARCEQLRGEVEPLKARTAKAWHEFMRIRATLGLEPLGYSEVGDIFDAIDKLRGERDEWMKPKITLGWTSAVGFEQDGCEIHDTSYSERAFVVGSHAVQQLQTERDALRAENERLIEALTPSGDTKAAYRGAFSFRLTLHNEKGEEYTHPWTVPWNTVKEIMKAIRDRAALGNAQEAG